MEFVLERSENIAIYRKGLSRQEACPALASKRGGMFTADGCHFWWLPLLMLLVGARVHFG